MKRINKKIVTSIALALLLNGCTTRIADLTLVSTKNIDLSNAQLDVRKGQRHKAEDCKFVFLGMIPFGLPNIETAIDNALKMGNGNVMVDEVTEFKEFWVVIGNVNCVVVEGTVLNTSENPAKLR